MRFGHIEVELGIRNLFVGPNAAGKSNLLDVFRFLHDVIKVGGGFQQAVRDRGGGSKYRIVFNQDANRRLFLKEEMVWKNSKILLQRPTEEDRQDPM